MMAIFTREIAEELIARGYTLIGRSEKAYFFEDNAELQRAVSELLEKLENY